VKADYWSWILKGNQLNVYQLREINAGFILDPATDAYDLVKLTDKQVNVILEASKGVKGLDEFAKGIRREQA
jgi:hypothetical protein